MFDWDDLRHFAAFARTASLSAASRELKVDHVTVSRRIAALETALGAKLVDRRARAYVLTEEGGRIADLASGMQEGALAIDRIARAMRPGLDGEVVISAPPGVAATLVAPSLAALRARHPGIVIRLRGEKRFASLSGREADLAIRLSRPVQAGLTARRVGRMRFGLYGTPAYLARHDEAEFGFIINDVELDDSPQQAWLRTIMGNRLIVLKTDDIASQQAAARAGLGLAALPRYVADQDPALTRLPIQPEIGRDIWIVVHDDVRPAPPVRAVMDFLAEMLRPDSPQAAGVAS